MFKIFTTTAVALLSVPAMADKLLAVADVWEPYTNESSAKIGYIPELVTEAMKLSGHTVEYRSWPFQRCLESMDAGRVDMLLGIYSRDADPQKYQYDKDLVFGLSTNYFYTTKNSAWIYKSPESLRDKRLGLAFGYDWGELNEPASQKTILVDWISDSNPLEKSLRKLLLGRIDVLVDDSLVVETTAKKLGVLDKIRRAGQLGSANKIYVAFPRTELKPKATAYLKNLSDGIQKMRRNGQFKRILAKYGIADWQ